MNKWHEMKILRRVLLVTTPLGIAIGLYEAWQLAGGLVVLMAAQLSVLGLVMFGLVRVVRREAAETRAHPEGKQR